MHCYVTLVFVTDINIVYVKLKNVKLLCRPSLFIKFILPQTHIQLLANTIQTNIIPF